jgi:hypothetical protein
LRNVLEIGVRTVTLNVYAELTCVLFCAYTTEEIAVLESIFDGLDSSLSSEFDSTLRLSSYLTESHSVDSSIREYEALLEDFCDFVKHQPDQKVMSNELSAFFSGCKRFKSLSLRDRLLFQTNIDTIVSSCAPRLTKQALPSFIGGLRVFEITSSASAANTADVSADDADPGLQRMPTRPIDYIDIPAVQLQYSAAGIIIYRQNWDGSGAEILLGTEYSSRRMTILGGKKDNAKDQV